MSKFSDELNFQTQDDVLHQGGVSDCFMRKVPPIRINHWQQHIEYILHLTHFSHYLMCVTGLPGVGKTTFIETLISSIDQDIEYRLLDANQITHPTELIATIATQFDLEFDDVALSLEEKIHRLNQHLLHFRRHALLIIDNAESWSIDTFDTLLTIVTSFQAQPQLHCLIAADNDIELLFTHPKLREQFAANSHVMQLNPFTEEECHEFIKTYLHHAGLNTTQYFPKDVLDKVISESGGIAYELKQFSIEHMREHMGQDAPSVHKEIVAEKDTPKEESTKTPAKKAAKAKNPSKLSVGHWVMVIGLTVMLGAMVAYQEEINELLTPVETVTELKPQVIVPKSVLAQTAPPTVLDVPNTPVTTGLDRETTSISSEEKPRTEENTAKAIISDATVLARKVTPVTLTPPKPVAVAPIPVNKPTLSEPKPTNSAVELTITKEVKKPSTQKKPTVTKEARRQNASKQVLLSKMEKRVLNMNSGHFALQLLGARDKRKIENFVKQQKLTRNSYYIHTKYRGKDWYVLLYGDFSKRNDAVNAIKKLPKNIQKMQPWPRRLADVQKSIKQR